MIATQNRLISEYEQLRPIEDVYREKHELWAANREAMRKHVEDDDLDEFLRWSTVRSAMFTVQAEYIDLEYSALMKDDTDRWMKALKESTVGLPPRYEKNEKTSGNLIHQSYHLMQMEKFSGKTVDQLDRIVEFGGGYGAMCAITRRLGFKGAYYIYDLPEFSLLQQYYLNQLGCADNVIFHQVDDRSRFPAPPLFTDYLIACYSLSETDSRLREVFINATKAKYVMLAMGALWGEKAPVKALDKLIEKLSDYDWKYYQSKTQRGNHKYLLGERNIDD